MIDYAGQFRFEESPENVWAAIEQLDQFERWWSWLGQLEVEGAGLQTGSVLRGWVRPPVPYRMHVAVKLEDCVPARRIDAAVTGDLAGDAHLRLAADGAHTITDVAWTLEMRQPAMRLAALVAHPLLRWGHDRVVEATVDGFQKRLTAS